jgi:hypothetical protein
MYNFTLIFIRGVTDENSLKTSFDTTSLKKTCNLDIIFKVHTN